MTFRTLELLDVPPEQLVPSPDGQRVAGWYVCHHTEDRYDERTLYHVAIWELDTGDLVTRFVRSYEIDRRAGTSEGAPVVGLDFSADGKELIIRTCGQGPYDQEQEEREPLP